MLKFSCLFGRGCRKEREEKQKKSLSPVNNNKELETLQGKLEKLKKNDVKKSGAFSVLGPIGIQRHSTKKVKVMSHDSPVGGEVEDIAYEGEDEHDENVSMKRDFSDCDLQARAVKCSEINDQSNKTCYDSFNSAFSDQFDSKSEKDTEDMIQSGHVSDPGTRKVESWASPKLKRSCSNLEVRDVLKRIADQLPLSKSESFEELQTLAKRMTEDLPDDVSSPVSVMSQRSADKVMLKKHSSSQILPSRSRKLWWKLFLWSHRNLHEPWTGKQRRVKPELNRQGGYSSDTLEPNRATRRGSPIAVTFRKGKTNIDNQNWDDYRGVSGLWPQNQWVAFSTESSSLTRVDEWVKEIPNEPSSVAVNDDSAEDGIVFPPSPDNGKSVARSTLHSTRHNEMILPEHIVHANNVVQSLNSSSTVAHISGIGLKVIPAIWRFSSLRSVNLSANYIVHIAPGSLPKGLHSLNLSRNKISTIEGLRELTRLRVLDLSYNRISRIGQGLSNCTLIKELYLAGNKISDVEGLHRLLKLTILDLSFNKITTTKALGQIVANYNSLLALNLLGNPIQNNISEDQLRKAVCSLLPKLAYLNKQPINTQKAREIGSESIARAVVGSNDWSTRRRAAKRVVTQGASSSLSGHRRRHRLKTRTHQNSPLKTKSALPLNQ